MSSKSKEKAEASGDSLKQLGQAKVGAVQGCTKKHWIGIVVKDTDGKAVAGIQAKLEADGSTFQVTLDKKGKYDTKKILNSANPAKITFTTLFDCEWWPEGDTAPVPVADTPMAAVAEGDCLVKIAHAAGYRDYHALWDATQNSALKLNCPVPNSLLKADIWQGPSKKDKSETKALDHEWTFIVRAAKKARLRFIVVQVVENEIKPWKGVKWTASGIATTKGETGADGLIEMKDVDPTSTSGTLKLVFPPPRDKVKAQKKSSKKLPDPPPYPVPINIDDFKEDPPTMTMPVYEIELDLKLGGLPTHKDKSGTLARLHNMALLSEVTVSDEDLARSVKVYQKDLLKQAAPSGRVADITEDVETRHTKP